MRGKNTSIVVFRECYSFAIGVAAVISKLPESMHTHEFLAAACGSTSADTLPQCEVCFGRESAAEWSMTAG